MHNFCIPYITVYDTKVIPYQSDANRLTAILNLYFRINSTTGIS